MPSQTNKHGGAVPYVTNANSSDQVEEADTYVGDLEPKVTSNHNDLGVLRE